MQGTAEGWHRWAMEAGYRQEGCGRVGCWRGQQRLWQCGVSAGALKARREHPLGTGRGPVGSGTGQGPGSLGQMQDVRVGWGQEQVE